MVAVVCGLVVLTELVSCHVGPGLELGLGCKKAAAGLDKDGIGSNLLNHDPLKELLVFPWLVG